MLCVREASANVRRYMKCMRSKRSSFSIKGHWDYLFNRQVMNFFLVRHGDKSRHFKDIERQQAISEEQKLKSC